MNAPKTYLVTGCAGFIGARVTEMLLDAGHHIVGVDNLNADYDIRLKEYRLSRILDANNFQFCRVDIVDSDSLKSIFQESSFDAVINLAARAGVRKSLNAAKSYMQSNAVGCLNLLELARQFQVAKFVLASTSSLYVGNPLPFDEEMPILPQGTKSPYGASKLAAESLAYSYHHLHQLDVSVVRYFTVYGPAGRPDMSVFRFIRWIEERQPVKVFGDGNQARDFTYIDDVARGTIASLETKGFEIFNLGAGLQPTSLTKLIGKLEQILGKTAGIEFLPAHPADFPATLARNDKAKHVLNWTPSVSLASGLQESVNWYLNNKPLSNELQLG